MTWSCKALTDDEILSADATSHFNLSDCPDVLSWIYEQDTDIVVIDTAWLGPGLYVFRLQLATSDTRKAYFDQTLAVVEGYVPEVAVRYVTCRQGPGSIQTLIARFMGPTWGPSGADRTQVGPMLTHELCYLGRCRLGSAGKYHCGVNADVRSSYLHNRIFSIDKTAICHCLGLVNKTMVCAVCLSIFPQHLYIRGTAVSKLSHWCKCVGDTIVTYH